MDNSGESIILMIDNSSPGDVDLNMPYINERFDICNNDEVDCDGKSFVEVVTNRILLMKTL